MTGCLYDEAFWSDVSDEGNLGIEKCAPRKQDEIRVRGDDDHRTEESFQIR